MYFQVTAPHFVAGIETATRKGIATVVKAAPILHWAVGMPAERFGQYAARRKWSVIEVPELTSDKS